MSDCKRESSPRPARRWLAVAVPLLAGACQSDSDNVMTPSGNALSPELVDLALGPELGNASANALEPDNGVTPAATGEAEEAAAAPPTVNRVDAAPSDNRVDESPEEPVDEQPTENE